MTKKIVSSIKYIAIFSTVLLGIISCEKDFENVGVGLVDNELFTTESQSFEVVAYNENVTRSQISTSNPHLLGVINDDKFGLLKSSVIAQLSLGSISFTDNMSIDAVVLDIPYYTTQLENNSGGTPNFELDSIFGKEDEEFMLSVYENGTYLNNLDPLDPTQGKKYYSNDSYTKKDLLYSGLFKPNANDTVLYVKRNFLDGDANTVDDTDTIKSATISPSIKIPLDTTFFRTNFIDQQNSGAFDSNDNFKNYFRGLIIEADGTDGSIMNLAMSNATMTFYYSNIVLTDETTTTGDLNGDGDTDDEDVPVKTKQTAIFPLSGVITDTYNRDYSEATSDIYTKLMSPDTSNGEESLYIQGAAGSIAVVELFKGLDETQFEEIKNKNWLINGAKLSLYIETQEDTIIPQQLFLYNYDAHTQILDAMTEASLREFEGVLRRDDDNKPLKYEFTITDYISEVLKSDESLSLNKLAIKVAHSSASFSDAPTSTLDTIVKDYSWNPKGVVVKGNNLINTDEQRLKLEIFYTVINE
ncbi:DUF4270 domain-containing protein [Aureibaculum sp. A20]|uniref:DUF4270 domain-containing protein n=1 Tax=Aureibaculum flavum TaxID=2795986 RepID=A0ABS0WPV5_9FLAO|nr:DUF4270 domain-containing protein [Aureibaculum flavum]MBJ2174010.1 DUF4270 domain-containing protein [Aureibaculum flavum]